MLYSVPISFGFRSVKVSATPTSLVAQQPSDPSASCVKPVPSLRAALHHAVVSAWVSAGVVGAFWITLRVSKPKAGPLAPGKAMVSGVEALFFSCKATLSSPPASILTTVSYLPHTSSSTHQPLRPGLCHLPLAQNTESCAIPASADADSVC